MPQSSISSDRSHELPLASQEQSILIASSFLYAKWAYGCTYYWIGRRGYHAEKEYQHILLLLLDSFFFVFIHLPSQPHFRGQMP